MDPLVRYFEPVSRLQLASKLRHLVRFSDLTLLIVGESGSGKSTLLRQLEVDERQSDIRQASIHCDETVDVTRLLSMLVAELGVDCGEKPDNRARLKALHVFSRTLHDSGTPLVLLFDDADYLTNNALELLINFALLEQGAPRVVLSGLPEFEQRFIDNGFDQLFDGRLHIQPLGEFEPEESAEYIETLLPPGTQLSARKIRRIIDESQGLPGRIYTGVLKQTRQGGVARGSAQAFPIPGVYIVVMAVILLGIVAGSVWVYLPEEEQSVESDVARVVMPIDIPPATVGTVDEVEVVDVRSELQQKLAEQESRFRLEAEAEEGQPTESVPDERSASAPAPDEAEMVEMSAPAVENTVLDEVKTQAPPGVKPPGDEVPAAIEPRQVVEAEVEAEKTVTANPPEKTVAQSSREGGSSLLRADELLQWPEKGYTLQLLGAREVSSVEDFIKERSNPERFYYFKTIYKGAPWHVVVYGQFSDRASAMAAVQTLPADLRKLRPWARSIAGVKSDIGKQ